MIVKMECPRCKFVGTYELDQTQETDLLMVRFVCANCDFVERGSEFRQVEKIPRSFSQGWGTFKAIVKDLARAYKEFAYEFVDTIRFTPEKMLNLTGWFFGVGIFLWKVIPIATNAYLDAEYAAGRVELTDLAIGFVGLAMGIFMLRKRWD